MGRQTLAGPGGQTEQLGFSLSDQAAPGLTLGAVGAGLSAGGLGFTWPLSVAAPWCG